MEKILKIEEVYNDYKVGYKIITNKQKILILIENDQHCCEQWGYLCSNDNMDDFIDSELISINSVNKTLDIKLVDILNKSIKEKESKIKQHDYYDDYFYGDVIFVNLETSKGTLQFAVYNEQNGYYGHDVLIKSNQCNLEKEI